MSAQESELKTIYSNRIRGTEAYRDRVWKVLISGYFGRYIPAEAAVLDLGSGYGQFINNLACGRKYAMDLNPDTRRLLNPGVAFLQQDCSARWQLPDQSLDVVFTSNFFEHLPDKTSLTGTVLEAFRCLKPRGRIVAMGPNVRYVGGAYWDFLDHHLPLTELSVKECLEMVGFRTELMLDRFLPYTMVNAPQYPVSLVRLYLSLPLVWKVIGKQFVVVASKP